MWLGGVLYINPLSFLVLGASRKGVVFGMLGHLTSTVYLDTTDGLDFKTPKFPRHVIYSHYRLDKENLYMQKIPACAILDELCYVC